MSKIFGTIGVIALLLVGVYFWGDVWSYGSTALGQLGGSIKESVPLDFELQRARDMVQGLRPEIAKNLHAIAKEEVRVAQLEERVEQLRDQQDGAEKTLLRLKADLADGEEVYYYAGRQFTADQVRGDLANRFERFKTNQATLDKLEQVLAARQSGLEAARAKLDQMVAAKRQLEVDIENLEARAKMVEVAQTASDFHFDNSHLSRTKELISDLQTRLEVAEKMVNSDFLAETIPVDEPAVRDIEQEVAKYFEGETESVLAQ